MKKAAALTLTVLLIFLCSCAKSETPQKICINRIFNCKIDIHYNETAYTADFTSDENGCNAVFLSPECLKGFKITAKGTETAYSLESISFSSQNTPDKAPPIQAVYQAINAIPESATENESGYTLCGNTKYGSYVMNIDGKNLSPTFVEYEEADITVKFRYSA